jgi:hypothetical protein
LLIEGLLLAFVVCQEDETDCGLPFAPVRFAVDMRPFAGHRLSVGQNTPASAISASV